MTAVSTKGTVVQIQNGALPGTPLTITAITKAKPPSISAVNTLAAGDVITFGTSTGFTELNGKTFVVGKTPTGAAFTLAGVDLTGSTGTMAAGITATAHPAGDFVNLCISELSIGASSVSDIDVGTLCGPATIAGPATLGSLTIGGYVDPADSGYIEVLAAEVDGKPRAFKITLPASAGYLLGLVTISSVSWGVPLSGAVSWSATASHNSQIKWVAP